MTLGPDAAMARRILQQQAGGRHAAGGGQRHRQQPLGHLALVRLGEGPEAIDGVQGFELVVSGLEADGVVGDDGQIGGADGAVADQAGLGRRQRLGLGIGESVAARHGGAVLFGVWRPPFGHEKSRREAAGLLVGRDVNKLRQAAKRKSGSWSTMPFDINSSSRRHAVHDRREGAARWQASRVDR
nr:hypothetical protein [Azospirillum thermophilum]